MRRALLVGFTAPVFAIVVLRAETHRSQDIEISFETPTVSVEPRRPGRFGLRLPSLTYVLRLTSSCVEDWRPASVSVNIADSRRSFDAEQLSASDELSLELRVPANQIAPLRVETFCLDDKSAGTRANDEENEIKVSAALSVHASLLCASGGEESITYVSKPLDVILRCNAVHTDEN